MNILRAVNKIKKAKLEPEFEFGLTSLATSIDYLEAKAYLQNGDKIFDEVFIDLLENISDSANGRQLDSESGNRSSNL